MAIEVTTRNTVSHARRLALSDPVERYRRMVEIRAIEAQIREFHESGQAWGSTHCSDGQEAVAVGIATAIPPTDPMWVAHRVHGLGLALGCTPEAILAENLGRTTGAIGGIGGSFHLTDTSIGLVHTFTIIGTQMAQALGGAMAAQVRGTDEVAVAMFGDGAANIGVFHESLNLASIWKAPVVFLLENNHYAEYTRYDRMSAIEPLARRGDAYSMPWEVVDGQDVELVIDAVTGALDRARNGGGPTLIELLTYRYLGHSRTDPALYRPEGELDEWLRRDPLTLYRAVLLEAGTVTADQLDTVEVGARADVAAAADVALAAPLPTPDVMFRNVMVPDRRG